MAENDLEYWKLHETDGTTYDRLFEIVRAMGYYKREIDKMERHYYNDGNYDIETIILPSEKKIVYYSCRDKGQYFIADNQKIPVGNGLGYSVAKTSQHIKRLLNDTR